jgi:RNA polymerase sigma-70 factor (ECF subfamily)
MTVINRQELSVDALLEHTGWARRLARSLVSESDAADDLVQESWLSALRRPPTITGSARAWLGTVLRNLGTNRAQATRRRDSRERAFGAIEDTVASPEELLARMEAQTMLAGIVTALGEPYRQCVLLRYYEDLSSSEIAARLGIPPGTVRWRLKVALEHLRNALDEKNEGNRARWLGLLAPLTPAETSGPPRSAFRLPTVVKLGATVAALATVSVGAWQVLRSRPAPGGGEEVVTATGSPQRLGGGPGGAGIHTVAAAALAACQKGIQGLRNEVIAAETEAMKTMHGKTLFDRGEPNPAAERELAPVIARIMKTGQQSAPSYALECRTWACKIAVATTPEESSPERRNAWMRLLQQDPDMMARKTRAGFMGARAVKDPVSGARFEREDVYVTLNDPAGRPAAPTMGPRPNTSFGPIPSTADLCDREAISLRSRLELARGDLEREMYPDRRFQRSPVNPALTAEINAEIRRIFSSEPTAPVAECRGITCKLGGTDPSGARTRLEADREFRLRLEASQCCRPVIFVMKTPVQLAAVQWLSKLLDDFAAGAAVAGCEKRHRGDGVLTVILRLKDPSEATVDPVSVEMSGALSEGPFGSCIAEEVARALRNAVPPAPAANAWVQRRFELPLAKR